MSQDNLTEDLNKWVDGDEAAANEVFNVANNELRRMARRYMNRENSGHTMGPTDLVNEAYVKLRNYKPRQGRWRNRSQFYGVFANAMRQILVDHAREKLRIKRGGGLRRISLDDIVETADKKSRYVTLLELDGVLDQLLREHPDAGNVFQQKYFLEFTSAQVAAALGITESQVNRKWKFSKLWLENAITAKHENKR